MSNNIESLRPIFQKAISRQIGGFANGVLYDLCKNYPHHSERCVILAKILLIGRAYAAAIERRKSGAEINDDFYEKIVVPMFLKSNIDKKISSLAKCDTLSKENLPAVLSVHKYLVARMRTITGLDKRSLASKYLHFHRPELFFIYDSRVARALGVCGKKMGIRLKKKDVPTKGDIHYRNFSTKALLLKSKLEAHFQIGRAHV